jgi:hypothetical protein
MKCVFWISLQLLYETVLIIRITGRDIIKNVYWILCTVHGVMGLDLSRHIFENTQISNFVKIRRVRAKLFLANERIERHDEANSRFFTILRTCLKIIDLLTVSQLLPKLLPAFEIFGDEFRSPPLPPIPFAVVRSRRPLCNSWHRLCCVLLQSF